MRLNPIDILQHLNLLDFLNRFIFLLWVLLENAKKPWYSILGLDAMPLSLKKLLLNDAQFLMVRHYVYSQNAIIS